MIEEIITVCLLAVGLAMDAFALSVANGLTMKLTRSQSLLTAAVFGIFQGLMPLIGYLLGSLFLSYIKDFDHWVAFALLLLIGGKMLVDGIVAIKKQEQLEPADFKFGRLIVQGVATSIDALAVGISLLAFTTSVYLNAGIIAVITFAICLMGVLLGKKLDKLFKGKTQIANVIGGVVLIAIAVKIVIEHTIA